VCYNFYIKIIITFQARSIGNDIDNRNIPHPIAYKLSETAANLLQTVGYEITSLDADVNTRRYEPHKPSDMEFQKPIKIGMLLFLFFYLY
jgi:hypothetical protein